MTFDVNPIEMVDLAGQYERIKSEIDSALLKAVEMARYINGPEVAVFEKALGEFLGVDHVVACANGTDALQVALMGLGLRKGDEVIVPAFTYVATAEVIALLGLTPVMVDVDPSTFNVSAESVRAAVTAKTKAIVPVHLFGQCCDMDPLMKIATEFDLFLIEDTAQAVGAEYRGMQGTLMAGTIGQVGCTSFFPSKNLGCFGDGGAMFTNDEELAGKLRIIANHGQDKKYHHSVVGVNSRLDTLQAAILNVKLKHLPEYCLARQEVAARYDEAFSDVEGLTVPKRDTSSTHVFHQYTLKVGCMRRDALKAHLEKRGIPSMIYYPLPLYRQRAYEVYARNGFTLPVTEDLCRTVLSIPIHTEMKSNVQERIIAAIIEFFEVNAVAGGVK